MAKAANPAPSEEKKLPAAMAFSGHQLPDHLRGQAKTAKVGNTDSTDLIIPRVKLMQKISPETETFPDIAKPGRFFHNVANVDMGPEVDAVLIIIRKTYALWAPRHDDRGLLARASDGVNWDIPDLSFEVKPKGSPQPIKYLLGKGVHDKTMNGLSVADFGSSIPGDAQSAPAASLTYEMMFYFPDHPHLSPSIIINTRSQVKPAKGLQSKLDHIPVDHYFVKFRIGTVVEKGAEGDYYNYVYTMNGFLDEATGVETKALYERFKETAFRANDERDDEGNKADVAGGRPKSGPSDSDKF